MVTNMKSVFIMLLLTLLIFTSCGTSSVDKETTAGTTSTVANTENIENTKSVYNYPKVNYGGEEFWMINIEPIWGYYPNVDFENMTGEILDDAVYERNRFLEEQFNFLLKVKITEIGTIYNDVRILLTAGDDVYDAIFITGHEVSNLVLENLLYNLYDIPEINLEEKWWEQTVLDTISYGNPPKAFFASNYMNLFGFQSAFITYFNEDMVEDLGLPTPYDYVLNGTWTFDVMHGQIKAGTNLNGDDSFAWSIAGNSVYGFSSYEQVPLALMVGMGVEYIQKDADDYPYLAIDNEHFYTVCEQLAAFMGTQGEFLYANTIETGFHFEPIFSSGRAFYIVGELKASNTFRTMEDNFGIVPMPKYDSAQEKYICNRLMQSLMVAIPITNPNVEQAGIIMDAMAYQSYIDVLPIFYDFTVSQKGLRNEQSIKMLDIIRESRYYDLGMTYGWTRTLVDSISTLLRAGNANVSSVIAAQENAIAANIEKTMNIG